jgi:alkaline phosphatase D
MTVETFSKENHTLTRRRFLVAAGSAAALVALPRSINAAIAKPPLPSAALFTLGVASGDPTPDGVVLWTRLAPDPLNGGGMPDRSVDVTWEVARDEDMRRIVKRGVEVARAKGAHAVHTDVRGLDAGREYWYRFRVAGQESPVGRTVTAPAEHIRDTQLRFAFASCQDWQNGYWPAHRHLAEEGLDLVLHLGDYIYEYGPEAKTRPGSPPARVHDGPEVFGLESYRNRHALYKTDPALQAAHARAPWIVTWDDHEVENNYADDTPEETTLPPGNFSERRANAFRAYYEHMPLRRSASPDGDSLRLYRRLAWGALADFNVLDTRQYRTDQPCGDGLQNCAGRFDPDATMTGEKQERWLLNGLRKSRARWNVLAQQTIFAEVDFNPAPGSAGPAGLFNVDQWDGYVAQRRRISEFLAAERPSNPIVLTGDIHSSWANEIKLDYDNPASPTVAAEFVGTSISSDFPAAFIAPVQAALPDNPHIKFFDGLNRGYVRCEVDKDAWRTDFRAVATVDVPDAPVSTVRSFVVEDGVPGLQAV